MQQATFAWPGYTQEPHRPKHRLDELDDNDQGSFSTATAGTGTGPTTNGVKFSEANLSAANAFVAASKRRKGNTGKVTLPPDFEPQFESLSLRGSNGLPGSLPRSDQLSDTSSIAPDATINLPRPSSPPSRGRLSSFLNSGDSTRGRRDGTPTVSQLSSNASHRKRSSSRNRARNRPYASDMDMKPAPRYDPSRPHVVFVDSLSDSEDDNDNDDASENDVTSGDLSSFSTPGNSPSSSDAEDTGISLVRSSTRPIQMNKRLRDHLRRQAIMERMGQKPPTDGILANSPATTGGAGIHERGLVLYRPLSFGIVEEPEEDQEEEAEPLQSTETAKGPVDEIEIQELPSDDNVVQSNAGQGAGTADLDSMELDEEMEID